MKKSHEPEEKVSVNFKDNTGRTTLWLQLTALCRPVKWWFIDKRPVSLSCMFSKDF